MHLTTTLEPRRGEAFSFACPGCLAPVQAAARFCAFCGSGVGARLDQTGTGSVADQLAAAPRRHIERRHLTIVFCDLVDSVGLSTALDPEDLAEVIRIYQNRVAAVMRAHGGVVARRLGDGTLVYFGYPHADEHDAERSVRAAQAAVAAVSELDGADGRRLQARIGIAAGTAIVGDVSGSGDPGDLDVAGEAANLAARLQGIAEPGGIVVADALRRQTGELFRWRDGGLRRLKGWPEPVRVWQPLGPASVASRFEALRRRTLAPLIGRETQTAALLDAWREARAGHGRAVLIRGEAGIGKSRLIARLLEETAGDRQVRLRYACSPHQREAPLHPFLQHLERFAGFDRDDPPEERRNKLERALVGMPGTDFALVADFVLAPAEGARPQPVAGLPHRVLARLLGALLDLVLRLAEREPVLAVFEDAQWSDQTSLRLLELALQQIGERPILLLITCRPDCELPWAGDPVLRQVALEPLSAGDAERLVRAVTGPAAAGTVPVPDIVRRCDGVPLFLEELTLAAMENAPVAAPSRAGALPATLHAALRGRLDRLGEARELAETAAAIGRDFGVDLLLRVTQWPWPRVEAALAQLLDHGLIVGSEPRGSGRYRFRHALLRDLAYGTLARGHRRALHQRIAEGLAALLPTASTARAQLLAHHWTEAGAGLAAARWWLLAAMQALRQSAAAEALAQIDRGLALLDGDDEETARLELDLRLVQGKALIATRGWAAPATGESLARATPLAERVGSTLQRRSVSFYRWTHAWLLADLDDADAAIAALRAGGEAPHWRLPMLYSTGMTQHTRGNFAAARDALEQGIALYEPARRNEYFGPTVGQPRVMMRTYLAWTQLCAGDIEAATASNAAALDEAREDGTALTLAHALFRDAFHASVTLSAGAALERLEALRPMLIEHGLVYYSAIEACFRGYCMALEGDPHGLPLLRGGIDAYRATGSRLHVPSFRRWEAEILTILGRDAEAAAILDEAATVQRSTGELWEYAETLRTQAGIVCRAGDAARGERLLRDAVALAGAQGAGLFATRAHADLARVVARNGALRFSGVV